MFTKFIHFKLFFISIGLLLSGCSVLLPANQVGEPPTPIIVVVTDGVDPSDTPVPTDPPSTPTPTSTPTETPVAIKTLVPTPTVTPIPCNWAAFVEDVTVKDGKDFLPETKFTKTWRLQNIGRCTWTSEYDLVFVGGTQMETTLVSLKSSVRPGETLDLSVPLVSPEDSGSYRGYWQLRDAEDILFGIGGGADKPFWVDIDVVIPCNWARFIADITVEDGTRFNPNAKFTKTWRLQNVGSCTWTSDYDLVFEKGADLKAKSVVGLPEKVAPGEKIDLSVEMDAPLKSGAYRGYWLLRDENGERFGLGATQYNPFWVDIEVVEPGNDFSYDFAFNYCSATWRSAEGVLECPGKSGDTDGFVRLLTNPALENRHENETALLTHPDEDRSGWISGKYPAIRISKGDHFYTWVGCLNGSEKCDVMFQLDYQIDGGPVKNLGAWHEIYDHQVTVIDLDLSDLAGEDVQFILSVEVNNKKPAQANAFWFVPHIE